MKYLKYIFSALALLMVVGMQSCSDDDSKCGAPVITGVRCTDAEKADSLFTKAGAGSIIVIVGENLATAHRIYINGQDVPFELPYVTDTHIILTIPAKLELKGTNPEVPNEIRVVTNGGEAVYAFHVDSPYGSISAISAKRYPVEAGDEMKIEGENFYEIERIYFTTTYPDDEIPEDLEIPAGLPDLEFDITGYTVDAEYATITFTTPQSLPEMGWFVVEMVANTAWRTFSALPGPEIQTISSDMPIVGTEVTITGLYFNNVMEIKIGENIVVGSEDINVSEDAKSLTFIMPALPSDYLNSMGSLTLTTAAGEVSIPFYQTEELINDWDGVTGGFWWGAEFSNTLRRIEADDTFEYGHTGVCYGIEGYNVATWWDNAFVMDFGTGAKANVYDNEPMSNLEVRMEVLFVKFDQSQFNLYLADGAVFQTENQGLPADINGARALGKWVTLAFPMNKDGKWGDYSSQLGEGRFHFFYPGWMSGGEDIEFYIDNIRIHKK